MVNNKKSIIQTWQHTHNTRKMQSINQSIDHNYGKKNSKQKLLQSLNSICRYAFTCTSCPVVVVLEQVVAALNEC